MLSFFMLILTSAHVRITTTTYSGTTTPPSDGGESPESLWGELVRLAHVQAQVRHGVLRARTAREADFQETLSDEGLSCK